MPAITEFLLQCVCGAGGEGGNKHQHNNYVVCQKVINAMGNEHSKVGGCLGGACGKTSGQRGQLEQSPGMEAFLTDQGTAKRPLWMEGRKGKRVAGSEGSGRKTRGPSGHAAFEIPGRSPSVNVGICEARILGESSAGNTHLGDRWYLNP